MQIKFIPKKIKASKAYIDNLDTLSKLKQKERKKNSSIFEKIKRFFYPK